MKTRKAKIIALLLATLLLFTTACGSAGNANGQQTHEQLPQTQEQPQAQPVEAAATLENNLAAAQDIGEGSTVFRFEVFDGDSNVNAWNVHTDAETVGAALLDVGLIDGDESEFGLMVIYVNNIRADFVEDSAWWAFYIDDEMAMAGVDDTEIEDGVIYKFIYTPA